MRKLGLNELRREFLDFFRSKEHYIADSYSLIPIGDPSVLLVNAGMQPLKKYFTGAAEPPKRRMATCQKCFRTNDIDNVGHTARHATMFEMLGNFSFGDYFKKETLAWGWEFFTKVLGIDKNLLWPSVYEEDEEAFEIWNRDIGVPAERITKLGKPTIFGKSAPVRAVLVRKFILIAEKSTDADVQIVVPGAIATVLRKFGITYFRNLIVRKTAPIFRSNRKILIQEWVWNDWLWSCRASIPFLRSIRSGTFMRRFFPHPQTKMPYLRRL